jgi:hypothetical protein
METLFPGSSRAQRQFAVTVTELAADGTPAGLGAACVRGWEVEHACGAPPLALRVELGGVSFAYSGDTQWTPALAQTAQGADLLAVEAYTFDRPIRYHLDYQTLRAHLGELHAERVVLTPHVRRHARQAHRCRPARRLRRHGHRPLTARAQGHLHRVRRPQLAA